MPDTTNGDTPGEALNLWKEVSKHKTYENETLAMHDPREKE
jgi:hypothetical protein